MMFPSRPKLVGGMATCLSTVRHPVLALRRIAGDGPLYGLLVLFGLNAVDELDRSAFGILAPEIRDEFSLGFQGLLTLIATVAAVALALQVVIAGMADRHSRVRIAIAGALAWSMFSFTTGLATGLVFLGIVRSGSAVGKAVNDPTHNSLLADWFPPESRARVFSFHRAANAVGAGLGPLFAGILAFRFGWRAPFLIFAFPTLVLVVLALRLKEPVRGAQERRAAGAEEEAIWTEEAPPSYAEAWRMCWKIDSLRRIFAALPFLAASLVGFTSLAALLYEQEFGLDERARGIAAAATEPMALIGLIIGARIATRLFAREPGLVLRFLAVTSVVSSGLAALFALSPNIVFAVATAGLINLCLAIVGPGVLASLSMAIPPRARSMGFSIGSLWVLPGLLVLPFIGWIADNWGIRQGMLVMVPMFVLGGLILSSAGSLVGGDIAQVWQTAAARSEVLVARRRGDKKLLLCRGLQVGYDDVQVLFDVDFDVEQGSIVALLGTNGAGKSTLLRAISGLAEATRGAVILDGRDITHAPPNEIAALGVGQLPGGIGVFPSLTVEENLRAAAWLGHRSNRDVVRGRVLDRFEPLVERLGDRAGDLSGGQQQMLGLAMAFLNPPSLLLVDELTLGLAPVVVEQLLPTVRDLSEKGTTVVIVEQSVNTALSLAETAYFMEKGQIRFHGPTSELLDRPEMLRSVFLEGATAGLAGSGRPPEKVKPRVVSDDSEISGRDRVPVLTASGMSRTFGGIKAVDKVSLSIDKGEILGLIGPNGAGKTTLFDLICGFTASESGSVAIEGRSLDGKTPAERSRMGLGRSFQDARLFPSLTVLETLAVALDRWTRSHDPVSAALRLPHAYDSERRCTDRASELIEMMGLERFRSKFVSELSTGTRRVLDLACVVAHSPRVVLLDEPSSGIAQREAEALASVIHRIRDDLGCAIAVVEHDMALLSSISDRLLALDQGCVIATGDPSLVLEHPSVIASYLGTNPSTLMRSGPTG